MQTALQDNSNIKVHVTSAPDLWLQEHGDYLFNYACRHFNDSGTAEELVQETLLSGIRGYHNFRGQSTVRTWLTGILKHKVIDRLRDKGRNCTTHLNTGETPEDEFLGHLLNQDGRFSSTMGFNSWGMEPYELIEQKEFMEALSTYLKKLPDHARTIFILKEVEGYSRKEIANKLNLSSSNTGVLLHRVRLYLRNCLEKQWFNC